MDEPLSVALLTCRHQPALTRSDDVLRDALEHRGARVTAVPWDTLAADAEVDVACLRSTWDYHLRPEAFAAWVESWRRRPGTLWNPVETVVWNMNKVYLRDLEEAGVPLPVSRWCDPGERPDMDAFFHSTGAREAVVKPRISATAYGTYRLARGASLNPDQLGTVTGSGALVQVFVPDIAENGELSLMFIDGQFSHAVRKTVAPGDFRVQSTFGGNASPVTVSETTRRFGRFVLDAAARPWVYARVDLVETAGGPLLMELELIEPELFLYLAPDSAEALAEALLARL